MLVKISEIILPIVIAFLVIFFWPKDNEEIDTNAFPMELTHKTVSILIDNDDSGYSVAFHRNDILVSFIQFKEDHSGQMTMVDEDGQTFVIVDRNGDGIPDSKTSLGNQERVGLTYIPEIVWKEFHPDD